MPNLFSNPFDENEQRMRAQEELELASRARLNAASRALGLGASIRPDARQAGANPTPAQLMSMLNNDAVTSPYAAYQRQQQQQQQQSQYARQYMQQQDMYSSLQSPADAASSLYGRAAGNYGYAAAAAAQSPDQYRAHYGGMPTARDYAAYYGQPTPEQTRAAALLDRSYLQQRHDMEGTPAASMSSVAHKSPSMSATPGSYGMAPKSPPTKPAATPSVGKPSAGPTARERNRGGRGGRGSRGGRGGRGGRGSKASPKDDKSDKDKKSDDSERWYSGSAPLGLPEDKYWLSELQVYLRSNFAEVFGATESDIAAPMHGRNKPIALGQVGVRCVHCKMEPPTERGQQATSYPSLISGIYNSVQQMLRLHFDCCLSMPDEVRMKIENLKVSSSARGGRKQYWIDSAKRLGLVDTPYGIHFGRDPTGPLPPLTGPLGPAPRASKKADKKATADVVGSSNIETDQAEASKAIQPIAHLPPEELYPLVLPEDKDLISDYLYLTLEQMQPCNLMEADKVGCYKGRKVGFPGLACKHCVGQAGCGRYFPASEASLSQTTTSQTIMNHVRNCRRCPIEIRENLELMKRARTADGKRADKPRHGGRKVFFHRLWCRIQRIPMEDEDETPAKKKKLWGRRKVSTTGRKKRQPALSPTETSSDGASDMDDVRSSAEEEEDTETEDSGSSDEESEEEQSTLLARKTKSSKSKNKKPPSTWQHGCVRLTKSDDPHWCSDMHCFVRSDLVEVFTLKKHDRSLDGYAGRKEPSEGQVGVRCVFCRDDPVSGSVYFPELVSSIHTKTSDLVRLHFPSCPAMPDDAKEQFKSLRGFGAKAEDDSHQYWIDSARDIGLADIPTAPGCWGITFRRDPLQPSPADDLDRENAGAATFNFPKSSLIRAVDRGLCTDQVMLLLRQVKPCRFKKTDRRGGPGSRGRDRVIGFPGLCCKHCTTKNNFGRYFPVSAKNLTDNTANSLLSHVASCTRCPEPIRASLGYLSHRSMLQKAELSGNWKKTFFKHVWDRLHIERAWHNADGEEIDDEDDGASVSSDDDQDDDNMDVQNGNSSESDDEEAVVNDMADMIQAAAVWLSEQESTTETTSARPRGARGRSLPTGGSTSSSRKPISFTSRGRGRGLPSAKRRRVTAS